MSIRHFSLLWLALLTPPLFAQTTTTFYPATPVPGVKPGPTPVHMPGVIPLFLEGNGFSSSLVVVNPALKNVAATITIRDLDGHQLIGRQIVLEKGTRRSVSVSSLLEGLRNPPGIGSLSILQDVAVPGSVIVAQLTVLDERNSTPAYIDEEISMAAMDGSSMLRGVADSADGPALTAITNLADSAQHVSVRCLAERSDGDSVSLTIAARATSLSPACSNKKVDSIADYIDHLEKGRQAGVAGYEIAGDGAPGTLAAFALAPHKRRDAEVFSAVAFVDPKTLKSSNTVYAGVPFGSQIVLPDGIYVPRVALTNFSTQPAHITIETSSKSETWGTRINRQIQIKEERMWAARLRRKQIVEMQVLRLRLAQEAAPNSTQDDIYFQ